MAISFVSSTRSPTTFPGSGNNTSTCIINKPSSLVANDVLIAFIETGTASITAPSGWTLINNYQTPGGSSNMTSSVYYRVVTGSEGSTFTWTDDSGDLTPMCGAIVAYRGVATTQVFNAQANGGNTGTSPTDPLATPTISATVPSWVLYFRAGKTATVGSEGTFSASGGALRQRFSNRGNSTQYYCEIWDSNAEVAAGSVSGKSMDGSLTLTGSIERTIAISLPTTGTMSASLSPIVADTAGTVTTPSGPIDSSISPVTSQFDGLGGPPTGTMDTALSPVTSSMAGTSTGGPLAASIPSITSDIAASVNPAGSMDATLPSIGFSSIGETRAFGEHVIVVEREMRGLRVTDDGLVPFYPSVEILPRSAHIEAQIGSITATLSGYLNSGVLDSSIGSVTASTSGRLEDIMKYTATVGNGSSTAIAVNHAMNTRAVVVAVYDTTTFEEVIPSSIVHTDLNNVTVNFATAPATNEYTVVVIGSYV